MDSKSIKINLLPRDENKKSKINFLGFVLSAIFLATSMALMGMFFISKGQVLACAPVDECTSHGFDYSIAKWEWTGSTYAPSGAANGTYVSGNTTIASWLASTTVAGVLDKEGLLYYVHEGGLSGTINKTSCYAISHITFCGKNTKCGNGIKEIGEQCDGTDGVGAHQTCSDTCTIVNQPYCGDGIKNGTEQCDDGTLNGTAGSNCTVGCTFKNTRPVCGNGIVESGEQCDDGNTNDLDSCRSNCTLLDCGDMDVILVMDRSASMGYDAPTRLSQAQTAANNFLGEFAPIDQSGLVSFEDTAYLNKTLSNEHSLTQTEVSGLFPVGATNIGEGIDLANGELTSSRINPDAAQIMILLTDGKANKPNGDGLGENPIDIAYALTEANEAAAAKIKIFTIGLGSDIDADMLKQIASTTGGKYYFAPTAQDLNEIFSLIRPAMCVSEPYCGDGTVDTGEQCDNGNLNGTTGNNCSATCTLEQGNLTVCKYNDVNKNSSYDSGTDTFLAWNMNITYPNGSTSTVQTSSDTGCTQLSNLPYGTYQVAEETKSGWVKSFPSENISSVTIGASSTSSQVIFLNYESGGGPSYGSIQICKLIDADGLASTTADQIAATSSIWNFDLISANGTSTKSTVIGNNCITYNDLLAGSYQVQEEIQSGWQLIDPAINSVNINLGSGENKTINFINSQIVVPSAGSITGYKYNDANNNGVIDSSEQAMSGWTIQLITCPYTPLATSAIQFLPNGNWQNISTSTEPISGQCTIVATTTTDSTGHYQFAGLNAGDYGVAEIGQDSWSQTYPANSTFYYFHLNTSETKTNINFANYRPGDVPQPRCGDGIVNQSSEQCDDGNNTNGDGCNTTCQTERGGGGGGGYIDYFNLYNTKVTEENCNAIVTWVTGSAATSRVYYDTTPHSTSTVPSADYAYSVIDDVNKVTGHNVTITGLKPNTTYYFRAYSQAVSTQYSQEIIYKTNASEQCSTTTVKGEEGKPQLAITKMVNTDFANAGQKGIEYLITVSNKGNLTAYGVKLKDLLPSGLQYDDTSGDNRSWDLGDLAPGTSKAVTYKVNVDANAQPLAYTNTATATATNQDKPVSADAKLEVRAVLVLAATGFSMTEFIVMISVLVSLISLSVFLKRKAIGNED